MTKLTMNERPDNPPAVSINQTKPNTTRTRRTDKKSHKLAAELSQTHVGKLEDTVERKLGANREQPDRGELNRAIRHNDDQSSNEKSRTSNNFNSVNCTDNLNATVQQPAEQPKLENPADLIGPKMYKHSDCKSELEIQHSNKRDAVCGHFKIIDECKPKVKLKAFF